MRLTPSGGASILDYLLHGHPTVEEDYGVFLGTTYRMHSAASTFISEAVYEGKLTSDPVNDQQVVEVPTEYTGPLNKDAGIIFLPAEHQGNTQASDEEIAVIAQSVKQLLGRKFTAKDGAQWPVSWNDILFVAPYNHQVNKLRIALSALPGGTQAKVGSVDMFQGREAPIVFRSMCTSDANESPRGLNFLLDKNRLNVAISRAQSLAIIVANPSLINTPTQSIGQMKKVNMFCHLVNG